MDLTHISSMNFLPFARTGFFGGVSVTHLLRFLCCIAFFFGGGGILFVVALCVVC